ncbi:MAG: LLM class F420-dependent oxidoreductase [Myxococcales bacterium]|nr:LLM class F420-dependent oxidoreductase [Myxococcales bacterium]
MHFGLTIFPTEYSISMVELGRAAEEREFESIWVSEHSHIPVSRRTPWPGGPELPKMYHDTLDPFVALAAAASSTSRIKLATGICLVVERDPIHTAKQVASIDQISGGRFLFGIGGGWNLEEMENHGTRPESRFNLMRERVEAMKAIWTQDEAEYHGDLIDFDPIYMWPKPAQSPHPPIHVGGGFPGGARRAIRYGDGWMPIGGRDGDIAERLPHFREMAREAGRDPERIEVSVFAAESKQAALARHRDAGISRVVLVLPPAPRDEILPILDSYASLMDSVG